MPYDFSKDKNETWIVEVPPIKTETLIKGGKDNGKKMSDDNKINKTNSDKDSQGCSALIFLGIGGFLSVILYDSKVLRFDTPQHFFLALLFAVAYVGVWTTCLNLEAILNFREIIKFFIAVGEQGNANRSGVIVIGVLSLIATIILLILISIMIYILKFIYSVHL